jgi:hypothetical protein
MKIALSAARRPSVSANAKAGKPRNKGLDKDLKVLSVAGQASVLTVDPLDSVLEQVAGA